MLFFLVAESPKQRELPLLRPRALAEMSSKKTRLLNWCQKSVRDRLLDDQFHVKVREDMHRPRGLFLISSSRSLEAEGGQAAGCGGGVAGGSVGVT